MLQWKGEAELPSARGRHGGMIGFLDILSFGLEWGYVLVFCWMLHTFLPLRRNRALRVLAFFACSFLAPAVISE